MPKNVLITGASRGIGRAIAYAFAQKGYCLYVTCRKRIDLLDALKKDLEQRFAVSCHIFVCDAGKEEEVEQLFAQLPVLDVVINNAGISHIGLLTDMTAEEWHRVMAVNLDSLFFTCRAAIPKMLSRHAGKIINISSVWGNIGASMEVAYSASKGGVNSFTKALAKELAPSNIQVNAIACGIMDTEMNAVFTQEELDSILEEIPACRLGQPQEAARLCVLLADAPSYLTGQIFTLDGGWT